MSSSATDSTHPVLLRGRCLRERHNASTCTLCVDACPSHALSLESGIIELRSSACVDCGACVAVCPTETFEMLSSSALTSQIQEKLSSGALSISCSMASSKPDDIRVSCLRALTPSDLLTSSRASRVTLVSGSCTKCPKHCPGHGIKELLHNASTLAALVGVAPQFALTEAPHRLNLGRRLLFKTWGEKVLAEPQKEEPIDRAKVCEAARACVGPSKKHARLLASLRILSALRERGVIPSSPENTSALALFSEPHMNAPLCTGCALCVEVCPTGALQASCTDGVTQFLRDTSLCTGCRLCSDVCLSHAVSLAPPTTKNAIFESQRVELCRKNVTTETLTATFEDKLRQLIDVPIYRT